jgi:hypothetical protein
MTDFRFEISNLSRPPIIVKMKRIQTLHRTWLLVVMLLAIAGHVHPQQPADVYAGTRAVSYSFVSPNTRENLALSEALRLLNSTEEHDLISATRKLSSCLGLKATVTKAVGSWADGAEHSTLFRVYTDQPTLLYADARLGKRERQKSVLHFRENVAGKGAMYILYPRPRSRSGHLASISKTLDRSGVAFRTLVPRPRRPAIVYVVDLKNELRRQMVAAARRLRARMVVVQGTGEFIGDDSDRDKAQQVFADVIEKYEAAHPQIGRACSLENR